MRKIYGSVRADPMLTAVDLEPIFLSKKNDTLVALVEILMMLFLGLQGGEHWRGGGAPLRPLAILYFLSPLSLTNNNHTV